MKFRKKPVVVEAMQYTIENCRKIHEWMRIPHLREPMDCTTGITIQTLEGEMFATLGDWIIKGVKGEFYPCKPDVFEKTYEKVQD